MALAVAGAMAVGWWLLTLLVLPVAAEEVDTHRLAGADRIETAVAISEHVFPDAAGTVYLARSDDFADALAAGPLTGGPVLLVPRCGEVPAAVTAEIDRLDPDRVTALGGEAAVCEQLLTNAATGRVSDRIAGPTRFETAVEIAEAQFPDGAEEVYVAHAFDSPDAVAGGVLTRGPILLVPASGPLPDAVAAAVERLDPDRVLALGGSVAVSDEILDAAAGGRATDRLAGPTRIETAAAIAGYQFGPGSEVQAAATTVYLARSDVFADAVAGGSLTDGPILLTPSCGDVPSAVASEIDRLGPSTVTALGGTAAICDQLLNEAAAGTPPPGEDEPLPAPPDRIQWVAVGRDGEVAVSETGARWAALNSYPFSGDLHDVAHSGDGQWTAVGDGGHGAISDDGEDWEVVDGYPHEGDVLAVGYGDGEWIAAGREGEMAISSDGQSWEPVDYPHTNRVNAVTYEEEDGWWVAVGWAGQAAKSPDGRNWTIIDADTDAQIYDVAHDAQGRWALVRADGNASGTADLEDGFSNHRGGSRLETLMDTAYGLAHDGDALWVAVGEYRDEAQIRTSTEAHDPWAGWTTESYPHESFVFDVAHDHRNRWVAVGDHGETALSNDGATWTDTSSAYPHDSRIHAVAASQP